MFTGACMTHIPCLGLTTNAGLPYMRTYKAVKRNPEHVKSKKDRVQVCGLCFGSKHIFYRILTTRHTFLCNEVFNIYKNIDESNIIKVNYNYKLLRNWILIWTRRGNRGYPASVLGDGIYPV